MLGSLAAAQPASAVVAEPLPHATDTSFGCNEAFGSVGETMPCTAVVTDLSNPQIQITPDGQLTLRSNLSGTFSGPCALKEVSRGTAECKVNYVPNVTGTHRITAAFVGNPGTEARPALEPSEGVAELKALIQTPTTTTVSCQPSLVAPGQSGTCKATVTDPFPSEESPLGRGSSVTFAANGPVTFSGNCRIVFFGGINEAVSCEVSYTLQQAGNTPNTVTASYLGDQNHAPSQGTTTVRGPGPTTTKLTCDPGQVAINSSTTCTVLVKDTFAEPSSPTGSVSLATNGPGNFSALQCTLIPIAGPGIDSSTCEVKYTPSAVGSGIHQLKATYAGDPTHLGSSGSFDLNVLGAPNQNPTATSLACTPNPVTAGNPTTCTATVTDVAPAGTRAAPSGKVAFTTNGQGAFPAPAECNLAPAGPDRSTCQIAYTPAAPAAVHQLRATYTPNDNEHVGSNGTFNLNVLVGGGGGPNQNATTTDLACTPNPVTTGNPVTCTATVTDVAPAGTKAAPSGKVAFTTNSQGAFSPLPPECNLAPAGPDRSTCQITYTPAGAAAVHQLRATYTSNDTEHTGSNGTFNLNVQAAQDNRNATTTDLVCAPASVIAGGGSVCTATVTDVAAVNRTAPGGVVDFASDGPGGFSNACVLVAAGNVSASCQTVYGPVPGGGVTHRITANYTGDAGHKPSQDSTQVTVNPPNGGSDTSTELSCEPSTVFLGGASVCTIDVEDREAPLTAPTGQIALATTGAGDFEPASCTLFSLGNGRSRCQLLYTAEIVGNHKLTALYPGDATHEPSRGEAQLTIVPPNQGHRTTTTVVCQPQSVAVSGQTTCTATVTDTDPAPTTPRRQVSFASNSPGTFNAGGCVLTAAGAGKATCTITYTPAQLGTGTHRLTAVYEGDPTHEPSLGQTDVTVTNAQGGPIQNATATELVCAPDPVTSGAPVTCTATVTDVATTGVKEAPSGQISFETNAQGAFIPAAAACALAPVGAAAPNSSRCQIAYTPAGAAAVHQLKATYVFDDIEHTTSNDTFDLDVLGGQDNRNATVADLVCAPASVIAGGGSVCTATVTDVAAANRSAPGGVVDFASDGPGGFSNTCVLVPASGQSASCQTVYGPVPGGGATHRITASYQGDAGHRPSQDSAQVTVNPPNGGSDTETELSCEPPSLFLGGASVCTVDVDDVDAPLSAPTGVIAFASTNAGNFDPASCTLFAISEGSSRCQILYTPSQIGNHEVTALYPGDAGHEPSRASADLTVVGPNGGHRTTTEIACNPAEVSLGGQTTCTATVTDTDPAPATPRRQVIFASNNPGTFSAGGCVLTAAGAGRATCTITYTPRQLGTGTHKLSAVYEGDPTHEPSLGETLVTVKNAPGGPNQNATTTALTCAPDPVQSGDPTTCTATVTDVAPAGAKAAPSGKVTFTTNAQGGFSPLPPECNLAPVGAAAPDSSRCQITYTPVGAPPLHQLRATYTSNDNEHTGSNGTFDLDVTAAGGEGEEDDPHATSTALECAPTSVILGGGSVCTVLVEDTGAADRSAPDGSVQFDTDGDGEFPIECNLAPTGEEGESRCQTIYEPEALGDGSHEITAAFEGNDTHIGSEDSADLTVTAPEGDHATATALECEPETVTLGDLSICTVNVRDLSATPTTPSGGVLFASDKAGTFSSGGCLLFAVAPGEARCQLVYEPSAGSLGGHRVTALYPGDAGHEPSENSDLVNVVAPNQRHDTTTALDCAPANVTVGNATTCTATVTDTDAAPTAPTRAVVFDSDGPGNFNLGGCQLGQVAGGVASCQITYIPSGVGSGNHEISAAYEGDLGHEPSPVATDAVTVTAVVVDPPAPAARESATSVACAPTNVLVGTATTCTATVTVPGANPGVPTGGVGFASDSQGTFSSGGACTLNGAGAGKATCQLAFTPGALGSSATHKITASYQGDAAHLPSQGSFVLQIAVPGPPQAVSAAPNTTLRKKPRKKTAARKAKFLFVSDQPGSRFQCKLDKKPFKPCRSPWKKKVKPGRHTFKVRAIGAGGLVDQTPASFKWKVGKAKKR